MLRYLVDPIFQVINTAGKPATGGYIEVYLHGTRDKYYCASDFDGTLHPFKIPLDSLGANIILADDSNAYDIYVYNRYGSLLMSRYNVTPLSIDDITESLSHKKNKQQAKVISGTPTQTVKSFSQNADGEIDVEFEDIDFPYNTEISSPDGSIDVGTPVVDPELKKETIPISVANKGKVLVDENDSQQKYLEDAIIADEEGLLRVRVDENEDSTPENPNKVLVIDDHLLREDIDSNAQRIENIEQTIDELDYDSVPRAYLASTLNQSPGDNVSTRTTIDVFSVNSIEGDCFEFEQTTTIDDTPFGYVWIEPGTYLINAEVTLQWVGNPRGTFIAKVGKVMGENFDFSQEQEISRQSAKVVTIPNRMKLAFNVTYDAGTPVMGFWIQSVQVVKLAGGMSQTTVAHGLSLEGNGSVEDPLDISEHGLREAFDYAKDEEYFATKQELYPLATKSELQAETARATQRENEIEALFTLPTQEMIDTWLDAHPEATTTVEDHSLTGNKLVLGTLNFVTPEMFGAVGDGVTDDTVAVQAAVDYGITCVFGNKTYYVSDGITLPTGSRLLGNGTKLVSDNGFVLTIAGADDYVKDVIVDGFDLSRPNGPQSAYAHGIYVFHAKDVTIQHCSIHDIPGDGIYIAGGDSATDKFFNDNVNIRYCKIKDWALATRNRQGIAVIQGCVNIEYCEIWQAYTNAWNIDVEPNYSYQEFDVLISRCFIHGGIIFQHNAHGRGSVRDCIIAALQDGAYAAIHPARYTDLVVSGCDIHGNISYSFDGVCTATLILENSTIEGSMLFGKMHRFIAHDCTLIEPDGTLSWGLRFLNMAADGLLEISRCKIMSDATNVLAVQSSSYNVNITDNTFTKIERTSAQNGIYLDSVDGARISGNRALSAMNIRLVGDKHEVVGNTGLFSYVSFNSAGNNFISGNKTGDTPDYVGATSDRPTLKSTGSEYFDTTLGKPIVWNGSTWVNMDGSAL